MFFIYIKEAYEEFKHALLALIYDKEDGKSPAANEVILFPNIHFDYLQIRTI